MTQNATEAQSSSTQPPQTATAIQNDITSHSFHVFKRPKVPPIKLISPSADLNAPDTTLYKNRISHICPQNVWKQGNPAGHSKIYFRDFHEEFEDLSGRCRKPSKCILVAAEGFVKMRSRRIFILGLSPSDFARPLLGLASRQTVPQTVW